MIVGFKRVSCLLLILILTACSSSRYSMKHDVGPGGNFDASKVPDAIPMWEALSPKGNHSPYTVRGKEYHLLDQVEGYHEEGVASWYGLKFHGELTSNGEVYNMYAMSAAHKTLPLPAYLKVTNLENQRSIVVRVNDRGPFHGDRIIDLSYAAAKKLGYDKQGTARVRLEALVVENKQFEEGSSNETNVTGGPLKDRLSNFIQVAALSTKEGAEKLKKRLLELNLAYQPFVSRSPVSKVYRVRVGPIDSPADAAKVRDILNDKGIGSPLVIRRPVLAKGS